MAKRAKMTTGSGMGILPSGYAPFLEDLKQRIRATQVKASLAANREVICLYWHIGKSIVERQRNEGWGKAVVERLSMDLHKEFSGMTGWSVSNIWRMRAFYLAWSAPIPAQHARELGEKGKLAQPVREITHDIKLAQLMPETDAKILSQPATELEHVALPRVVLDIPWGHNVDLIQRVKNRDISLWYAQMTLQNGWSRSVLKHQIESGLHDRQGKAVSNFALTLPSPQSDLVQQTIKDPYIFDFLPLAADAVERDLEKGLTEHIEMRLRR